MKSKINNSNSLKLFNIKYLEIEDVDFNILSITLKLTCDINFII